MSWLYVPGLACSPRESELHASFMGLSTVLSVTSKGKSLQPRSLLRLWKQGRSIRRLSGMTLSPSVASNGVKEWIASLGDFHASPGARRANKKAPQTNAGSGLISHESFAKLNRHFASLKTCGDLFQEADLNSSLLDLPISGCMRNGVLSRRPMSVLRKNVSEFSYWLTVTTSEANGAGHHGSGALDLRTAVSKWPTPDCNSATYSNGKFGPNLRELAAQWMTPCVPNGGRALAEEFVISKGKTPGGEKNGRFGIPSEILADAGRAGLSNAEQPGQPGQPQCGQQTWSTVAEFCTAQLGHTDVSGLRRQSNRSIENRINSSGSEIHSPGPGLFAPGPVSDRWEGIVANEPHLAPAIEPDVRVLVDGMAYLVDESRSDQLRAVGNGVVPLAAAVAFVVLARRAGIFTTHEREIVRAA